MSVFRWNLVYPIKYFFYYHFKMIYFVIFCPSCAIICSKSQTHIALRNVVKYIIRIKRTISLQVIYFIRTRCCRWTPKERDRKDGSSVWTCVAGATRTNSIWPGTWPASVACSPSSGVSTARSPSPGNRRWKYTWFPFTIVRRTKFSETPVAA